MADVFARSPDAEFILDGEFEEDHQVAVRALEWRECVVPVAAFSLQPTLGEHLSVVDVQHHREALSRLSSIEVWIDRAGGIDRALFASPILATWRNGKLHVEDGWHRLGSAAFRHGLSAVRIICADLFNANKVSSQIAVSRAGT